MAESFYDSCVKSEALVEKIISRLLRNEFFFPFIPELLHYKFYYTDKLPAPAAVRQDTETIYINPTHPIFDDYDPLRIMAFCLLHEDLHILLEHTHRLKHRDKTQWNWACDFVINLLLLHLSREAKNSPRSCIKILDCDEYQYKRDFLLSEKFENMVEEEVYNKIQNLKVKKKETSMSMQEFMSGGQGQDLDAEKKEGSDEQKGEEGGESNGKEEDDPERMGNVKITESSFTFDGKTYKHVDVEFPPIEQFIGKKKSDELKDAQSQRAGMNRHLVESSLSKGIGSDALKNFLKRLLGVKIDWKKILADCIATAMEKTSEMTWSTPRNVWLANAHDLPYLPNVDEEEKYGTVFISIDESGSMSDDDVRAAVSIILQAKDHFKDIFVVKHDDGIRWEKKYNKDEVDIDELLIRRHCGGTSHRQVFQRAQKYLKEDPDGMISCFIAITDMYSDIESHQNKLDINIPRVYIVNNKENHRDVVGRVIHIN